MIIAIRGASGFIGSNFIRRIIKEGKFTKIISITRKKKDKLREFNKSRVEIHEIENLDLYKLRKVLKNVDIIYDFSGIAFQIDNSLEVTSDQIIQNSIGAFTIASAISKHQKLFWISSSAVDHLNDRNYMKKSYAFSKYIGEKVLLQFPMNIKIIRLSDVFGQEISEELINPNIPVRRIQRFVVAYQLLRNKKTKWIKNGTHGFYRKREKIVHEINNDYLRPISIGRVVDKLINLNEDSTRIIEIYGSRVSNYQLVKLIQKILEVDIEIIGKGDKFPDERLNSLEEQMRIWMKNISSAKKQHLL